MASNQKLTEVLKGRVIQGTSNANGKLTVHFDSGLVMTVLTQGNQNSASTGGSVKEARQEGTVLTIEFEGGMTWDIQTAAESPDVVVRDRNDAIEYTSES